MTITLPARLEALVRQKVESGSYQTTDEVIQEALHALDERDRLKDLRAKLQIGLDQLDLGKGIAFSSEWSAERYRIATERAKAGNTPDLDVFP